MDGGGEDIVHRLAWVVESKAMGNMAMVVDRERNEVEGMHMGDREGYQKDELTAKGVMVNMMVTIW